MQAHLEQEPAPCGPVNFTLFLYNTILETICFCLLLGLTKGIGGITWATQSGSPGKVIWVRPWLGWFFYKTKLTRGQILHFTWTLWALNSSGRKHLIPWEECEMWVHDIGLKTLMTRRRQPDCNVSCGQDKLLWAATQLGVWMEGEGACYNLYLQCHLD